MYCNEWKAESSIDYYLSLGPWKHIVLSYLSTWVIYMRDNVWDRKLMIVDINDYEFKEILMKTIKKSVEERRFDDIIDKYKGQPITIIIYVDDLIQKYFEGGYCVF